jgi:heme A synthase
VRRSFTGLALLLMLAVVIQFFLAASGAFDSARGEESFRAHRVLGFGIVLIALLAAIAAAVARLPGRLAAMSGLVAGLAVLQSVIRAIAAAFEDAGRSTAAGELIFGLHAVNGLAILAVVMTIVREAGRVSRPAARQAP